MNLEKLRAAPGRHVRLDESDPRATPGFDRKADARAARKADLERLCDLQEVFAAARSHALLLIFQGMDSAGKDGAIAHVMAGINPQGVDVHDFKAPTDEELAHDFLWRCARVLPARGRIGIFNRSYYEEVIVVRVHKQLLARESAAPGKHIWAQRFEDINAFEQHLARNGTVVLKFFLHLSKDEQCKRLLRRLDDPDKHWKFSADDIHERKFWREYQSRYEQAIEATSTDCAPWYVIPADHKWFARTAIAAIVVKHLESLGLHYPKLTGDAAAQLEHFRQQLASR